MTQVYPLIFKPIFKPRIWGGRKLETLLAKSLPPDGPIGESWEIADLEDDQSVVASGPARGTTLSRLVEQWGSDLIGGVPLFEGRFPLLIKFLDAHDPLSVQVHPSVAVARKLGGRIRVKNEAWYVLDADEDGCIYRGVRAGVDADALRRAIDDGRVESVLNRIPVRKGHCYYLPSGTIHALGGGVVVAEVQTPSDITYRVYDWGRVDASTGSPRTLHLAEALECISFDSTEPAQERAEHVASLWSAVTRLIHCESFVIERVRMTEGVQQSIPYEKMVIWMVLEGRGSIRCDGFTDPFPFTRGDTVLLPAGLKQGCLEVLDNSMWLEVTVPVASSLSGFDRPSREARGDGSNPGGGYVQLKTTGGADTTHEDA